MLKRTSTRGRWGRKSNSITNADGNTSTTARARAAGAVRAALEPLEGRLYMFATDGRWNNEQPGGPGTPLALRYSYSNLLDGGLPTATGFGSNAQIRAAMEEALGLWTAVAPIQLTEVPDSGGPTNDPWIYIGNHPEIRIGHVPMDGTGTGGLNELAHAYLPNFWTFAFRGAVAGDLYFDDGDRWGNGATGGNDMVETGAHELGHALGMAHANGDTRDLDGDGQADCPPPTPALMDACAASLFSGPGTSFLFSDDVNGIRSIYGAGLGFVRDMFGGLHINGTGGNDAITISSSGGMITVSSAGNGSFTRPSIDLTSISVMGRGGNDSVTINSAPAGVSVFVEGDAGNDTVFVGGSLTRNLGDVGGIVAFAGGAGSDRIGLNDQNGPAGSNYTFSSSSAGRGGWMGMNFSSVETIDIGGAGGNCVYNVDSLPAASSMTIDDGQGMDVLNVAQAGGNLDTVGANINFHGLGVSGNWVHLFDQNNSFSQTYTFENNAVDRGGSDWFNPAS